MQITTAHREQYAALTGLGINRKTAISMIARQIRKSLPTIDTSEADQRREDREREQSADHSKTDGTSKPQSFLDRIKKPNIRSRKYITAKVKRLTGAMVTRYRDGSLLIKPQNAPPKGYDPGFTLDQQADMLQMIAGEFKEQNDKNNCQKDRNKEAQKEMKKSQRFEKLVQVARANPQRLTPLTLSTLNAHLAKTGQPAIPTPQQSAPQIKNPVTGTSYARMTTQEHQQFLLDQALQRQAEAEANKTPEVKATWYAGDQPTFRIV
jgi:hypothetical protein